MKIAFVIGNGLTRKTIGLSTLIDHGTVFGCNYAVKDIPMHHLIAVDRNVVIDLLSTPYPKNTVYWTRHKWTKTLSHEQPIYALPETLYKPMVRWDLEHHWGSGTHAVWKASEEHDIVVMLGFDLWSNNKTNNNVYAGKHGYGNNPIDPRCWIYQLRETFVRHPAVTYVQIQPDGWTSPKEWKEVENFSQDNFEGLAAFLKNN